MGRHGLTWDDVAADYEVEVWPQTVEPLNFFRQVCTQWRTNGSLVYGLDYNVFPMIFDLLQIPESKRRLVFEQVRVMEEAALLEIKSKRTAGAH